MTPEETTYRDMWMAEMWKPCRELSKGDRWDKRQADRAQQRLMEEQIIHRQSTGCAENGVDKCA